MENPQENTAHPTSSMSAQRQRLRAIVDRNADLFDPPNTAEAFARIEAAMDEANHHSSADSDITGHNDMLDPPKTAERFARIEAAMNAVFEKSTAITWSQRQREKSRCETRVPVRNLGLQSTQGTRSQKTQPSPSVTSGAFTNPQAQMHFDGNAEVNDGLTAGKLLDMRAHDNDDGPVNEIGGPAEEAHVFAGNDSKHASQRDTDIFRSSVAVDDFANKAYQSARAKYLGL